MTAAASPARGFKEALRVERESASRSVHDVARGVSVSQDVYRAWEDGTSTPTKAQFGKLCLHFRRLRHCPPTTYAATLTVVPAPAPSDTVQAPDSAKKKRAFGDFLREAREAAACSQDELGAMLGVTGPAVSKWERDETSPTRDNYAGLLDLFDLLKIAPEPDWQNIDVPDGGRGVPRTGGPVSARPPLTLADAGAIIDEVVETCARPCSCPDAPCEPHHTDAGKASLDDQPVPAAAPPEERPAEPEQATPAPEPVDTAERLVLAYVEVFGGGWKLSVEREGSSAWCVTISSVMGPGFKVGEGPGVSACYAKLFAHLDAEIDRRIAALEALRRRTR